MMLKTPKNCVLSVAIVVFYTLVVWNLAMVMVHHRNKGDTMSFAEKRLEESNENWLRGLESRKKLESKRPLDPKDQWNFKSGVTFWDFFYPNFDCPYTVERVGGSGDGGKWTCGLNQLRKKPEPCIVYSYGIGNQFSFEEEILERTNCLVFMFDHTITIDIGKIKLPAKHPGRAFIENIGLGVKDSATLSSLKSKMKQNGHTFVDILKVDIEGEEYDVMNSFKHQFPNGLPFGQLEVEIHVPKEVDAGFYDKYKKWMTNLEDMGLRPFRNELNLLGSIPNGHPPNLCEYSYLNVKTDHWLLH